MPEGMVLSVMKRSSNDLLGYHKVVEESIQSDEPVACEIRKSKQWALKSQRVVKKELFLFVSYVAAEKNKRPINKNKLRNYLLPLTLAMTNL